MGLGLVACLLWLPALSTPFWGDDYHFLQEALASRLRGEAWWIPFWPDVRYQFWRPLGHETYWRFVEGVLGADARAAHLTNLVLFVLVCFGVGLLGASLAWVSRWERPLIGGALAAGIYAVSAVHFTPLHWTSSGDSLMIVLWTSLALAAWVRAPMHRPAVRALLCAAIPIVQVLALYSKESAVLIPLLMLCVSAFAWGRVRPGLAEAAVWLACVMLILVWLAFRGRFVLPAVPEYELEFGTNVLRNGAALLAWCLNVPREALRMLIVGPRVEGAIWALAAALPMTAFLYISGSALVRLPVRQAAAVGLFVVLGYAPYYLLAWQSYEYYAQVAIILPAILLARGLMLSRHAPVAACLFALSSYIAVEGSRSVGYPGLIGRARSAEEQLSDLAVREALAQAGHDGAEPYVVQVANLHEFYAIGKSGLAWRLALAQDEVAVVEGCNEEIDGLFEFRGGRATYIECALEEADELT